MKRPQSSTLCPLCGGQETAGKTTFTVDFGAGVVVIKDVPATVCSQCGADWIADIVAEKLELVEEARRKQHQVEVFSLGSAEADAYQNGQANT